MVTPVATIVGMYPETIKDYKILHTVDVYVWIGNVYTKMVLLLHAEVVVSGSARWLSW